MMSLKNKSSEEVFQLVRFFLEDREYAINVFQTKGIVEVQETTPLPEASEYIRGVSTIRGELTIIIDLKKRLGSDKVNLKDGMAILLDLDSADNVAVVVDEVNTISRVNESRIGSISESTSGSKYIKGVIEREDDRDDHIVWLDIGKIISEEEIEGLENIEQ